MYDHVSYTSSQRTISRSYVKVSHSQEVGLPYTRIAYWTCII